ncbi:unnamed protein product [Lactuca saligna]|uniref:Uncharacterized protein n=1 Tax=Lactuca saligna TaxID=75948 RepID=A0AA35Z960_LACSI|nr:unnamed protein product [Lactuca saligna]
MWRGNDVGQEAKDLPEAIERHYPNTFKQPASFPPTENPSSSPPKTPFLSFFSLDSQTSIAPSTICCFFDPSECLPPPSTSNERRPPFLLLMNQISSNNNVTIQEIAQEKTARCGSRLAPPPLAASALTSGSPEVSFSDVTCIM